MTTPQTDGLLRDYKPLLSARVSRRGLLLCSSLIVFASLAISEEFNRA